MLRTTLALLPPKMTAAIVSNFGGMLRRISGRPAVFVNPEVQPLAVSFSHQHCFFGYYDISPFDSRSAKVLACRCPIAQGRRTAGTPLELGYILSNGSKPEFFQFAKTTTWCWQQGARLQWLTSLGPDCVIYNSRVKNKHGAILHDIKSGETIGELNAPIYAVDPQNHIAISVNFSRLQRLRPGYGYDDLPDKTRHQNAPDVDGLWSIDIRDGSRELIFSLHEAASIETQPGMEGCQHYFNHIAWNPSGTRFLLFHIWSDGRSHSGRVITLNRDGTAPYLLTNEAHVSHYCWLSDQEILLTSTHQQCGTGYHVFRDNVGLVEAWPRENLPRDGHPTMSPKGTWVLSDSVSNIYRERELFLYDRSRDFRVDIGRFFTPAKLRGEIRCDLHPRWSSEGNMIAVDASHSGKRTMMIFDISSIITK